MSNRSLARAILRSLDRYEQSQITADEFEESVYWNLEAMDGVREDWAAEVGRAVIALWQFRWSPNPTEAALARAAAANLRSLMRELTCGSED